MAQRSKSDTEASRRTNGSRLSSHFSSGVFGCLQDAQRVATQNLLNVAIGITLLEKSVGDLRQVRYIVHAVRHVGAVEIGAEADVIRADEFHCVIDMVDDESPIDTRQLSSGDEFPEHLF